MHAGWSIGTVAGGLLGALGAGLGAGFTTAMMIFGLSGFPLAVVAGRWYLREGPLPSEAVPGAPEAVVPQLDAVVPARDAVVPPASAAGHEAEVWHKVRLPTIVMYLGIVTFCVFLAEGAVADWSGVLMHEHLGATEVVAATAYPLFEGVMAVVRLSCEKWSEHFSVRAVVVISSLIAAAGLTVVASAVDPVVALVGFVVVAVGACLVGPLMLSQAGRLDAGIATAAIARVSTLGYSGLLIGPVAIGLIGNVANLRVGFAAVIVACVCWAAIGWWRLRTIHTQTVPATR
jgi:sugar phosphate permease